MRYSRLRDRLVPHEEKGAEPLISDTLDAVAVKAAT
jgi:hypothetical protein